MLPSSSIRRRCALGNRTPRRRARCSPSWSSTRCHTGNYTFLIPKAVPSYLLTLAIGDLDFKETGPRSGVFAEASLAKAAAKEFADTEAMLAAAEQLLGHHPWGRFDQLVMPAAFPIGEAAYPA